MAACKAPSRPTGRRSSWRITWRCARSAASRWRSWCGRASFVVGPWYVLPDEFLVSGESLVRNLRHGRELVRGMGGAALQRRLCVRHLSATTARCRRSWPGLASRRRFIWRGLNQIDKRHVLWRGADGTVMPSYRFGHVGYCSYAAAVRQAFDPSYRADPEQVDQDLDPRSCRWRPSTARSIPCSFSTAATIRSGTRMSMPC